MLFFTITVTMYYVQNIFMQSTRVIENHFNVTKEWLQ